MLYREITAVCSVIGYDNNDDDNDDDDSDDDDNDDDDEIKVNAGVQNGIINNDAT
jgi:hypothetical protein